MLAPQVAPRPELGSGDVQTYAAFQDVLNSAQEFIRPAVIEERVAAGEAAAQEALKGRGPDYAVRRLEGRDMPSGAGPVARPEAGETSIPAPDQGPEYELQRLNDSTFEARRPFTVADAAFNEAAKRIISARAASAMEQGLRIAAQKADGDVGVLRAEMETLRGEVIGGLPEDLAGLRVDMEAQFNRAASVATRQAMELAERRVIAQQRDAAVQAFDTAKSEMERLALSGATSDEIAAHMASATEAIAQYGPRSAFTLAGKEYPADPKRAGLLTAAALGSKLTEIATDAKRVLVEVDFERSGAKGAYAREFRRQLFSGNSPFSASQGLQMLRGMEAAVRAEESRRRAEAERYKRQLRERATTTINAYTRMTEAGVPVAIPEEERAAILEGLAPFPDLQREAMLEFQVADAAVETFNMTGPELMDYVGAVRSDMRAAAEQGVLDLDGAAVIESLGDRVKSVRAAVTSESIGLDMTEQFILSGGSLEEVDYDGIREQAAGKPDLIEQINEVETFHREVAAMGDLSASEREVVLERARAIEQAIAISGEGMGAGALMLSRVTKRLTDWTEQRRDLAASDPVKFAEAVGQELPGFDGVESLPDAGRVIAERVAAIAPRTQAEGVQNPVPLTQAEIEGLSEIYRNTSRADRAAFVAQISELGPEQATAIFDRIGATEPSLFAAGRVHASGNQKAAGVIMRGADDTKLGGGTAVDVAAARSAALGPMFEADMAPRNMADLDRAALAYARGVAMADGGREIEIPDIEDGYQVALGRQEDGTGGMFETDYGVTILPAGWDGRRVERAISGLTDDDYTRLARGLVVDGRGQPLSASQIEGLIATLQPSSNDPNVFVPLDDEGGVFLTDDGETQGILTFDLREIEQ